MTTPTRTDFRFDITAAPRAVLRETLRLVYRLLGEKRLGSARSNAWASVCADRERAQGRAEVSRMLALARGSAEAGSRSRQRLPSRLPQPSGPRR